MTTLTRELCKQAAWVVLAVGVASALQAWAARVVGMHAPLAPLPFYAAVAVAAWQTSFGGGLAAVATSAIAMAALASRHAPLPHLLAHAGTFVAIAFAECVLVAIAKPLFQERSLAGQRRCRSRCRCRRRFATARTGRRAADDGRHDDATRGRRGPRRNRRRRRRTTDHELESGRAADLRDRCRCSRRAETSRC
ncbi:Signal transduction histidine kinase [Burkholderia dolosa AU0158]|nr:Signal transduction histidine kinase [Burkholderia dolosa AU0158]